MDTITGSIYMRTSCPTQHTST